MKSAKRAFATLFVICILAVLLLLAVPSVQAETLSGVCGEHLTWEFDSATGTLKIAGSGAMSGWKYMAGDDRPWESLCKTIRSVVVEEGVTTIADYAFDSCPELRNVTLANSVTEIGEEAFADCRKLERCTMPENLRIIGDSAFEMCQSLKKITIPGSVILVESSAFSNCDSLTEVTIEEGVQSFNASAFNSCDSLTSIFIPSSVNFLPQAFSHCVNLTSITVHPDNPYLYSAGNCVIERNRQRVVSGCSVSVLPSDGNLRIIGEWAFRSHQFTTMTIPKGVTTIENGAFYACRKMESIIIPQSVTTIGSDVFYYCADNFTIYGYRGTRAETYANENNIPFVALCSDHSFGAWSDNGDGTHTRICTNCEEPETQKHSFDGWTSNGTVHVRSCPDCGARETQEHSYGKWVDQGSGGHGRSCDVCGKTENQSHSYGGYAFVDEYNHMHSCTQCNREEKLEHTWDIGTVTVEPTEETVGTRVYKCTACGAEKQEDIPKLDHEHAYTSDWKTDASNHWKECYCGDKGNIGSHTYDEGQSIQDATCQQEGEVLFTCTTCGHQKIQTATGSHVPGEWITVTEPTCVETGVKERTCTICAMLLEEQILDATGHTYGQWVVTKEPTETESGEQTRTCHCGATETQALEPLGTTPDVPQTDPAIPEPTQNEIVVQDENTATPKPMPIGWIVGASVTLLLLIFIILILILRKKRQKEADE